MAPASTCTAALIITIGLFCSLGTIKAQPGAIVDASKPDKYSNRTLASERTGSGRINPVRRIQQNIVSRYNYFFNASNELSEVIATARKGSKDDFTRLLPFDDYSLESTASQKEELDSVILKCNNGILLHDLRNDWVDDLYLLMGLAYLHRKEFDSAIIAFQYINYSFQPRSREEMGIDRAIGSRYNDEGDVFTISTPEKKGLITRAVTHTPARNDAILWMLRTLIYQGRMNEASGLIETLRRDASMPKRLLSTLDECQAFWFYQSSQWDSCAIYLERSMDGHILSGRARKEYLVAQLYERAGMAEQADRMYRSAISRTTDPVLEAHARISQIGLGMVHSDSATIRKSLLDLDRMARRSRYEDYRQIVHFAAYRLELQRGDTAAAMVRLRNSIQFGSSDAALKSRSFAELGDLSFIRRDYVMAADSYDSVQVQLLDASDTQRIAQRSGVLRRIAIWMEAVREQDSLIRIASMPEAERKDYVQKLARSLRKAQGLKEEAEAPATSSTPSSLLKEDAPVNLFAGNEGKGEWYFYNGSLRGQGYRQFQTKWGKRPNLDNWRRIAAIEAQLNAAKQSDPGDPDKPAAVAKATEPPVQSGPKDLSFEGLMSGLPLTDSLRNIAHDSIQHALLALALTFRDELDMCEEATRNLTSLLDRYPQSALMETVLYHLCACLKQSGDLAKYEFYKRELAARFGKGRMIAMLENPITVRDTQELEQKEATAQYEQVAVLMIQGRFDEAMERKRQADSSYGRKYWTSQLQYIEALYLIRERNDSLAVRSLKGIQERDPGTPLARRAKEIEDVLKRRAEIEDYLTKLDIKRYPEDSLVLPDEGPLVKISTKPAKDTSTANITPVSPPLPMAPLDSAVSKPPPTSTPTLPSGTVRTVFLHQPADSHAVILVLNKVDVVYRNEARLALIRYNRANYPDSEWVATSVSLTEDIKLVQVSSFNQLNSALTYSQQVKSAAATQIFPWLPVGTYRFLPISLPNLELLLQKQDIEAYLTFLRQTLPGEF